MTDEVEENTEEVTLEGDAVVEEDTPKPAEKITRTRTRTPKKVRLQVVYSKLNYKGTIYSVGDVLELTQEEADELLGVLSGRPRRHLEYVD